MVVCYFITGFILSDLRRLFSGSIMFSERLLFLLSADIGVHDLDLRLCSFELLLWPLGVSIDIGSFQRRT